MASPRAQRTLAESRVRFLTADTDELRAVRETILASWRRSLDLHVAADKVEMHFEHDLDLDNRLSRTAEPVLRRLSEQLAGQSVSVILTDPSGLVLRRLTGDHDLEQHLDRVLLAPGFNYAEQYVGTNGIGTALEMGGPAHVFGHEHYAEDLEMLACAGVPIHHPISGRLVGAVDLTCWHKDAGALLLTLAKSAAEQISQALFAAASASQLELFQEYLRACSRRTGAVFALNSDVAMLNDHARGIFDPADQATLLAQVTEAMARGTRGSIDVELGAGRVAHLHCRSVGLAEHPSGVVAHVTLDQLVQLEDGGRPPRTPMPLPSLVGFGPTWLHACHEVERVFRSGEWLAVEGEPGVGKLALLRAVQLRRQPVGRFVELDAHDASADGGWITAVREALLGAGDSVVIRHVDTLDAARLRSLSSALQDPSLSERERPVWVAVTLDSAAPVTADLQRLLRLLPSTITVPPLRLHLEDLPLLVQAFLSRLVHSGRLVCSPEAMRLLMRMSWPGNAEQVHRLLRDVVRHRRTGIIRPEDLPPEAHTVSRRVLSPLEAMERDAIVTSLLDAHGNKVRAARDLGMSRASIYRKIHDYGIVTSRR